MKVTVEQFKNLVAAAVREEVSRQVGAIQQALPGMIAESFSDRFLKKIVAESAASSPSPARPAPSRQAARPARPNKLKELMMGDIPPDGSDEPPEPLENDDKGIYSQAPFARGNSGKQRANEGLRSRLRESILDEREGPSLFKGMEDLFAGTKPAPGLSPDGGSPLPLGETQQEFGEEGVPIDFLQNALGVNLSPSRGRQEPEPPRVDESKLRELERRRAALEVRA